MLDYGGTAVLYALRFDIDGFARKLTALPSGNLGHIESLPSTLSSPSRDSEGPGTVDVLGQRRFWDSEGCETVDVLG